MTAEACRGVGGWRRPFVPPPRLLRLSSLRPRAQAGDVTGSVVAVCPCEQHPGWRECGGVFSGCVGAYQQQFVLSGREVRQRHTQLEQRPRPTGLVWIVVVFMGSCTVRIHQMGWTLTWTGAAVQLRSGSERSF